MPRSKETAVTWIKPLLNEINYINGLQIHITVPYNNLPPIGSIRHLVFRFVPFFPM